MSHASADRGGSGGADDACAAIDVGTNTILLLVARVRADGEVDVVEDHCVTARLGDGVARTGRLRPEAVTRGLDALHGFRRRIDELGIPETRVRAVGTAVFRRARDAREFVVRAAAECRIAIDVLSEDDEARLSHSAVVGRGDARTCVVDVGGGSTEVIANGGRQRASMPIGALTLTEAHMPDGVATRESWNALQREIERAATALPHRGGERADDLTEVVVVGGTALNLASLALGLDRFDPVRAEGARVPSAAALRWAERLAFEDLEHRALRPIEPARAMILPAGLACLAAALAWADAKEFRASGRGLRFGVLRELALGRAEGDPRASRSGIE